MAYLDEQVNAFHRWDYYFAQIAAEIRRIRSKRRIKLRDFLLTFNFRKPLSRMTRTEREAQIAKSKQAWGFGGGK